MASAAVGTAFMDALEVAVKIFDLKTYRTKF